ncbi:MAG TPA: hypothetical protein VFE61_17290 [Candidatus Sulfotelmatobacter sp.]|nr:hypothetical protein [Candidatus Sulfotelmatobacter sp.]
MREQTKTVLYRLLLVGFAAMVFVTLVPAMAYAQFVPNSKRNPLCQKLGTQMQGSSGMQMYCFGPQHNGASPLAGLLAPNLSGTPFGPQKTPKGGFIPNVNAANLAEDISPSGVRAFGQSETSIAAAGPYVVEAWNDATGFFAACGSPMNKEELTGFAFSNDGGQTFTDLGGLPNLNCATSLTEGDPSVEVYQVGGNTYFYISSIFVPFNVPQNAISVTACEVVGSGSTATLGCGQPIVAGISSDCIMPFPGFTACSFLDKDFMSIDAARGKLYVSYTEFGFTDADGAGQIELAACDLTVNPANPTCFNGSGFDFSTPAAVPPYLVVSANNANFCEQEGAYPAVDPGSGDVYVAFEFNWATNQSSFGPCAVMLTKDVLVHVSGSCLTSTSPSPCAPPFSQAAVNIVSTVATLVPGYNRFPSNDFPRIAVSDTAGTVSIVWNDARTNPLGDVLMQSFNLGSLTAVQSAPVRLNNDGTSALHFLPAVRYADSNGRLSVSWYDRRLNPNSAITDVFAALGVDPRTASTPSNSRVTDVSSDWLAVSSDIVPNFGDYTDNYIVTGTGKHVNNTFYVAWSDGRLGDPQPFEAHH